MAVEFAVLGWPDEGPTLRLDYRAFAYAGKFAMSSTGKAVARDPDAGLPPVGGDPAAGPAPPADGDASGPGPPADGNASGPDPPAIGDPAVVGAVAFDEDRTDPGTLRLRYVTVRRDRQGEGIGPALVDFLAGRARERGYDRARIAVNNPHAYEALYRAGFEFTGEPTGIAELVLDRPLGGDPGDGGDGGDGGDAGDGRRSRGRAGAPDPAAYREGLAAFAERDLSESLRSFVAEKRAAGPPTPGDPGAGPEGGGEGDGPARSRDRPDTGN